MDMLERVARAICKSRSCHGVGCCEWPCSAGEKHKCVVARGGYDDAARAAIEAMREPTEAMLEMALDVSGMRVAPYDAPRESGVALECDMSEEDAAQLNEGSKASHADLYIAMIDASLHTDKSREGA